MKALEILYHLEELYNSREVDKDDFFEKMMLSNNKIVNMWEKAFEPYDESAVLQAIDELWRFNSNKTRPKVSQILAMLNTSKEPVYEQKTENYETESVYCPERRLANTLNVSVCKANSILQRMINAYRQEYPETMDYPMTDLIKSMHTSGWGMDKIKEFI
jgi:hypothetical protein